MLPCDARSAPAGMATGLDRAVGAPSQRCTAAASPHLTPCHAPATAIAVIEYWTFSLFYCASELWGSVVISVLFWSLANEVCTIDEAKVRAGTRDGNGGLGRLAQGPRPATCGGGSCSCGGRRNWT